MERQPDKKPDRVCRSRPSALAAPVPCGLLKAPADRTPRGVIRDQVAEIGMSETLEAAFPFGGGGPDVYRDNVDGLITSLKQPYDAV